MMEFIPVSLYQVSAYQTTNKEINSKSDEFLPSGYTLLTNS